MYASSLAVIFKVT